MRTTNAAAIVSVFALAGCSEILADFTFYDLDAGQDGGTQQSDAGPADSGPDSEVPCTCEEPTPYCTTDGCGECLTSADCDDGDHCTVDRCGADFSCSSTLDPTCIAGLAPGRNHTCAWRAGGRVACWGSNEFGQLGAGPSGSGMLSTTPLAVPVLDDAVEVGVGWDFSCVLHEGGSVSCWGNNMAGQLGNGTTTASTTPVTVVGVTDATWLSVGAAHACALRASGSVACWGSNTFGKLGNGSETPSSVPVAVLDLADAVEVSVGRNHSCARRAGGTVMCWGWNESGRLGNGSTANSSRPVAVLGLADAVEISAGDSHTCARRVTDQVVCWGNNAEAQLGDDSRLPSSAPIIISDLGGALDIAAGGFHTCARRDGADPVCWGSNIMGQLGNGSVAVASATPVVASGLVDAVVLDGGFQHACAVLSSGDALCWGANASGQLGDGTTEDRSSAVVVQGL